MTAHGLHYRLLGALTVERDGTAVELGPPKQRAVLALLLLHRGRVVSTDRLMDALWAESAPPSALSSLQAYVSNLRRALRTTAGESATIVRRSTGYAIDVDADRLDVATFVALAERARAALDAQAWADATDAARAALTCWRGEPLEDLRDQPWVDAELAALDGLRTECRETLITGLLAENKPAPAVEAAQALRAAHPDRDRACWLEMIALHRAGRTPDALDVYRAHARRLDDELGLEPGPEVRELQVAILRHDPALAAWPRPAGWTGASSVQTPAPAAAVTPEERPGERLIGREREAAVLDGLLADARGGRSRWALLTGPAGIGKTRLAQELAAQVRAAGGAEAWGRCSDEDGAPAWWPIRQVIRALGEDPDTLLQAPPGVDLDEARFALYERVAALVQRRATEHGLLLLVLDDVQWSDRTSARCLAHLVGALQALPVVVVLTLRDDEDDRDVAPMIAALARHDGFRQLTVGPLSPDAVRELTAQVAGEPVSAGEAEQLAARTGGNALFVSEYARLPAAARQGDLPLAVRAVLDRRLDAVRPEVMPALRAAAVIGDVVEMETLAAVTDTDADALADLLDEAADEHLLVATVDTGSYAFAHGLVREAILASLPGMRRQRLHARVAATLDDPADGDRVVRRAQHLVAALPLADAPAVLDGCRAAARVATERWSSETAAEWWAEAVRVFDLQPAGARDAGERDDLLVEQVAALARSGRGQTLVGVLETALADAMRADRPAPPRRLSASLLRAAGAWPWGALAEEPGPLAGRLDEVVRFVADEPAALAQALAANAVGWCYHPDPGVPDERTTRAITIAETLDGDVLADALLGRLITYSGCASRAEESLVLAERLQALPHREAPIDAVIARSVTTMSLLTLGRVVEAADAVREAGTAADRLRLVVPRLQVRYMEGTLALWRGDVPEAERLHGIAERVHRQTELYWDGSWVIAGLSRAWVAGTLADADPTDCPALYVDAWRAAIAADRGDAAAVRAHAEAQLALQLAPELWTTHGLLTLLAHAAADVADADLGRRLLARLEPYAGRLAVIGHIGVVGPVDLARGRLQALLGDAAGARRSLQAALDHALATGGVPAADRCAAALRALGA